MKKMALGSMASILIDGMIYFSDSAFNGFYCYDIKKMLTKHICDFEKVSPAAQILHRQAIRYGDYIVLIPYHDKFLRIFDIESGCMSSFPLIGAADIQYVYCGTIHDNLVWLVDDRLTATCFDLVNHRFSTLPNLTKVLTDLLAKESKIVDLYWESDKLFCLTDSFEVFYEIFEEAGDFKAIMNCLAIGIGYGVLSKVRILNQKYWLLFKNHYDIIEWDGGKNYQVYKYELADASIDKSVCNYPYDNLYKVGEEILITAYYGKNIFYVRDAKVREVELSKYDGNYKVLKCLLYSPCFGQVHQIDGGKYLIFPNRNNRLIELNTTKQELHTKKIWYEVTSMCKFISEVDKTEIVFHENENTGLGDLIDYLVKSP